MVDPLVTSNVIGFLLSIIAGFVTGIFTGLYFHRLQNKQINKRKNFYFSLLKDDFIQLQNMVNEFSKLSKEVVNNVFKNINEYPDIEIVCYKSPDKDYDFPTPIFMGRLKTNIEKLEYDIDPELVYKINEIIWVFGQFYGGLSYTLVRSEKVEDQLKKDIQARINDMNEKITKKINVSKMAAQRKFYI